VEDGRLDADGSCLFGAVLGSDGRIYVIGGYNDSGYLSAVDAYDPSTTTWSAVAPLEIARLAWPSPLSTSAFWQSVASI
jgi:Kelch motif